MHHPVHLLIPDILKLIILRLAENLGISLLLLLLWGIVSGPFLAFFYFVQMSYNFCAPAVYLIKNYWYRQTKYLSSEFSMHAITICFVQVHSEAVKKIDCTSIFVSRMFYGFA